MQKEYNIKEGQSLADIAVMLGGDISKIMELSRTNNIGVSDPLHCDDLVLHDDDNITKKQVADYYSKNNIIPATASGAIAEGIDFWTIEGDFIIS